VTDEAFETLAGLLLARLSEAALTWSGPKGSAIYWPAAQLRYRSA